MSDIFVVRHSRIVGALVVREMATRFGREGLGFLWVVLEPLVFCFGVLFLWSMSKPDHEHGIRLAPFVLTGYMSLIVIRHFISQFSNAFSANIGLFHHRLIAPVHVFMARACLEFLGSTTAFIVGYIVLMLMGELVLPADPLLLYAGWLILTWVSAGLALVLAGLAMRYDFMERLLGLISYLLIPLSGAFFMMDWIPERAREILLWLPFPHAIEMVRGGVFGEFVKTHYDPLYPIFVGAALTTIGLLLISASRGRVDSE